MKKSRLTVSMAMSRLGKSVMVKVSDTDGVINPDDIILGADPDRSIFYVCSPKQKLRVKEITITNEALDAKTVYTTHYIVDDKINVKAVRITDIREFVEVVGYFINSVRVYPDYICLPDRTILYEKNTIYCIRALIDSKLCCMESDDTHTFDYVNRRCVNLKHIHRYTEGDVINRLWRMGGRY